MLDSKWKQKLREWLLSIHLFNQSFLHRYLLITYYMSSTVQDNGDIAGDKISSLFLIFWWGKILPKDSSWEAGRRMSYCLNRETQWRGRFFRMRETWAWLWPEQRREDIYIRNQRISRNPKLEEWQVSSQPTINVHMAPSNSAPAITINSQSQTQGGWELGEGRSVAPGS